MTVLLCPLCSEPRFHNVESLRLSLINAATQSIVCPTCSEVLIGLDKLTIHLFTHATKQNFNTNQTVDLHTPKLEFQDSGSKLEKSAPNICFLQSLCVTDIPQVQNNEEEYIENNQIRSEKKMTEEIKIDNSAQSTVNLEDLSHLTAWNNNFSTKDSKLSETKTFTSTSSEPSFVQNFNLDKEVNIELSEYMSELLNKKLPILNFFLPTDTPENSSSDDFTSFLEEKKINTVNHESALQNLNILSKGEETVNFPEKTKEEKTEIENSEQMNRINVNENINTITDETVLKEFSFPSHKCHLCSKAFKIKGSLSLHYRVAHLGILNSNVESSSTEVEEKNYQCFNCVKSFKKEPHLLQHIKTHEGKQWHCETCNKYFTTKYFLKKHKRLHTGEMPYACQTCNKTFTFQQSYYKHLLYHSDEKPYPCSDCGRAFKELSTLHNHQRIHSGEKPFICETCGKRFRQRVSYIVHQRIHTGVLPYQCQVCEKKFRYKVSLRSHKCLGQPPGAVAKPPDAIQQILN